MMKMNGFAGKRSFFKSLTFVEITVFATFLMIGAIVLSVPAYQVVRVLGGLNIQYGSGVRTGVVYKLSRKGIVWKTYEGEMSLQLTELDQDGRMVNKIFHFSVSSERVAKEIEKSMEDLKPVTIRYNEYLARGFRYGSTGYDVVSVEPPKPPKM